MYTITVRGGDSMLDSILAIVIALMNVFGGPFDNENANVILRQSIYAVQEYNAEPTETENKNTLPKVMEGYDEEVIRDKNHKPSILDYDGNTLYNFYNHKAMEQVNKFHSNIAEGGI